jgi:hypothetical protein
MIQSNYSIPKKLPQAIPDSDEMSEDTIFLQFEMQLEQRHSILVDHQQVLGDT